MNKQERIKKYKCEINSLKSIFDDLSEVEKCIGCGVGIKQDIIMYKELIKDIESEMKK